jgi:signal peptidase II
VTDFIVWRYKQHEWPAFNVADAALVIGVGLMFIDMLKGHKVSPTPQQPQTGGESA